MKTQIEVFQMPCCSFFSRESFEWICALCAICLCVSVNLQHPQDASTVPIVTKRADQSQDKVSSQEELRIVEGQGQGMDNSILISGKHYGL